MRFVIFILIGTATLRTYAYPGTLQTTEKAPQKLSKEEIEEPPKPHRGIGEAISLALLIDTSGSMAGEKIKAVRQSVVETARTLNPEDYFAVFAFDANEKPILPMQKLKNVTDLENELEKLHAQGGTRIFPALKVAAESLRSTSAAIRHIVILTDGATDDALETPYYGFVNRLAAEGITVSTVGIRSAELDSAFLSNLALWGHGKFYPVESGGLSQVLTVEAKRIRELTVENKPKFESTTLAGTSENILSYRKRLATKWGWKNRKIEGNFSLSAYLMPIELTIAIEYPSWKEKRLSREEMITEVNRKTASDKGKVVAGLTISLDRDSSSGKTELDIPSDLKDFIFLENDLGESVRCTSTMLPSYKSVNRLKDVVVIPLEFPERLPAKQKSIYDGAKKLMIVVGGLGFQDNKFEFDLPISNLFSDVPDELRAFFYNVGIWQETTSAIPSSETNTFAREFERALPKTDSLVGTLRAERDKEGGVLVSGQVRLLPEKTKLWVILDRGRSIGRLGNTSSVVLAKDGTFRAGPFSMKGDVLPDGDYLVEVTCHFSSTWQSKEVLEQVGVETDNEGATDLQTNPTKLPKSSDLVPFDPEFPEHSRRLTTLRSITIYPLTEEMRAIQEVKTARLEVAKAGLIGGGASSKSVGEVIAKWKILSAIKPIEWSASKNDVGSWVVTFDFYEGDGKKRKKAQWQYDPASKTVKYLDPEAKALSWSSSDR